MYAKFVEFIKNDPVGVMTFNCAEQWEPGDSWAFVLAGSHPCPIPAAATCCSGALPSGTREWGRGQQSGSLCDQQPKGRAKAGKAWQAVKHHAFMVCN